MQTIVIADDDAAIGNLEQEAHEDAGYRVVRAYSGTKALLALKNARSGLVLDEPINGLDPEGIVEMRELILKLNREHGITALISSRIFEAFSRLATHYGFIEGGRMMREMSVDALETARRRRMRVTASNAAALSRALDVLGAEYQILSDTEARIFTPVPVGTLFESRTDCVLIHVSEQEGSLESFYMNLVGDAMRRLMRANGGVHSPIESALSSKAGRLSKNLKESSRGSKPSRITIVHSGVYGGHGAILSQGNPIFRRENRFFADFATGVRRTQAKSVKGVAVAGEAVPPSTSLSK